MSAVEAQREMLRATVAQALASMPRGTTAFQATVGNVQAGAAADGFALTTVNWQGQPLAVPYLASYTPVTNHRVLVLLADTDPVILGRIVGTPT